MKWKAEATRPHYANGTTRLKNVFAWLPVYIDGFYVWLSTYEVLEAYIITTTLTDQGTFANAKWVPVSKKYK